MDPEERYQLVQNVGEGSYGAVWKGVDKVDGSFAAIKIIPIDDDISELNREISILKKCDSDFVVRFYDSYEKDKHVWIVMELCEAGSVNDLMHICDKRFDEPTIRAIIASCILGLEYLHSHRMIHRDIKAGNVLLSKHGQAKLADFGVSAQLSTLYSKRKTVIGTPFWMAPEVIQESQYDGKADIWSLGITLIEVADLEPPYSNIHPMRAIFMIPSRPPPKFHDPSKWSPQMNSFLASCLQKNPELRPSASELRNDPFVQQTVIELDQATPIRGASALLKSLVDECTPKIIDFHNEEMLRASKGGSSSQTGMKGNTLLYEAANNPGSTMIREVNGTKDNRTLNSSGTVVLESVSGGTAVRVGRPTHGSVLSSGTVKTSGVNGEEPSFMSYFMNTAKKEKKANNRTVEVSKAAEVDELMAERARIRERIRNLDNQFKKDFRELKIQYDKRKNALIATVGNKGG